MNKCVVSMLIVWFGLTTTASAEITVGRWCDQLLPNNPKFKAELSIVVEDNGDVVLRSKHADGSSGSDPLDELGNDIYANADSPHGEKYRIVPKTGELQLIDNDGLIRTANRLENDAVSGDCLP